MTMVVWRRRCDLLAHVAQRPRCCRPVSGCHGGRVCGSQTTSNTRSGWRGSSCARGSVACMRASAGVADAAALLLRRARHSRRLAWQHPLEAQRTFATCRGAGPRLTAPAKLPAGPASYSWPPPLANSSCPPVWTAGTATASSRARCGEHRCATRDGGYRHAGGAGDALRRYVVRADPAGHPGPAAQRGGELCCSQGTASC